MALFMPAQKSRTKVVAQATLDSQVVDFHFTKSLSVKRNTRKLSGAPIGANEKQCRALERRYRRYLGVDQLTSPELATWGME